MAEKHTFVAQWVLVAVTLFWGSTFLIIHTILEFVDPIILVLGRFSLASLFVFILLKGRIHSITRYEWKAGFWVGLTIWAAYTLQCVGLQAIPSSTSAFLTGLYVAFVPLCQWVVFRQTPTLTVGISVCMAFVGMSLFANPFEMSFTGQWGEWITILSALICAGEILTMSHFAQGSRPLALSFTQLVTVAGLSAATLIFHEPVRPTILCPQLIGGIVALAAIVAFVQFGIAWALKSISALRATLTYSLEPVFAGIFGWLAGETLGLTELTGGSLIIAAVLLSALKPNARPKPKDKEGVNHVINA